jgi:hypothetical protein
MRDRVEPLVVLDCFPDPFIQVNGIEWVDPLDVDMGRGYSDVARDVVDAIPRAMRNEYEQFLRPQEGSGEDRRLRRESGQAHEQVDRLMPFDGNSFCDALQCFWYKFYLAVAARLLDRGSVAVVFLIAAEDAMEATAFVALGFWHGPTVAIRLR